MIKDLEYYIYKFDNFFSNHFMNDTLENVKKLSFKEHLFYKNDTEEFVKPADNQNYYSEDDVLQTDTIMRNIYKGIQEYQSNFKFPWFKGWSGYTKIRFNRYNENQNMHVHCDHIHDIFDGQKRGIPSLSIIGLLNDDFEGGNLEFFDDYEVKMKQGDLLMFPSNFLYPHKVKPITEGVRYSYVSWVW